MREKSPVAPNVERVNQNTQRERERVPEHSGYPNREKVMGNNNIPNSSSQPLIPMFRGENYHLWSLEMKTMFKSQELWDLVESGYTKPKPKLAQAQPSPQLRKTRNKDEHALFLIQSALDDEIFPRIAAATTSCEA